MIDQVHDNIRKWAHYYQMCDLYAVGKPIQWGYTHECPYKDDVIQEERRMCLHSYSNADKAVESERNFHRLLSTLQKELESGTRTAEQEKQYAKYLTVTSTPKRRVKVAANTEATAEAKNYHGYFLLLSNMIEEPFKAWGLYRNKDVVKKAFGNLKERLNMRRTVVSTDRNLDGKLFIQFIALIYLSYLKKHM